MTLPHGLIQCERPKVCQTFQCASVRSSVVAPPVELPVEPSNALTAASAEPFCHSCAWQAPADYLSPFPPSQEDAPVTSDQHSAAHRSNCGCAPSEPARLPSWLRQGSRCRSHRSMPQEPLPSVSRENVPICEECAGGVSSALPILQHLKVHIDHEHAFSLVTESLQLC